MAKKTWISVFLLFVVLSASFYFILPDKVRIDIEKTKTEYSVYENGTFILAATERVHLYDGTTKMRAKSGGRKLRNYSVGNMVYVERTVNWKDNITTIQTYGFDPNVSDVEQFPISNEFQCINCEGKIVHYEIRDILYEGETKIIESPFSFGHNMQIEWEDGAYFSKVYQQKSVDKIIIKYKPQDNDETYSVRLFDPWTDNYIVGLQTWWTLNESSGTNVLDSHGGTFNGTTSASPDWKPGYIGNALNFSGDETNYVDFGNEPLLAGSNNNTMTFGAWVFHYSAAVDFQTIYAKNQPGTGNGFVIATASVDGKLGLYSKGGSWDFSTNLIPLNEWVHIAVAVDSGTATFYLNGEANGTSSGELWNYESGNASLGYYGENAEWEGMIDEPFVYNRSLNSTEIYDLFSENLTYFGGPFGPVVTAIFPTNNSVSGPLVKVNCSAESVSGNELANISFWHDKSGTFKRNLTNVVSGTINYTNFSVTFGTEGSVLWGCSASDLIYNESFSENKTVIIDVTLPDVTFKDNFATNNNTWLNVSKITADVEVTEINPSNITYSLFNSSEIVNQTIFGMSIQTSNITFNWSNLNDGNYTFNVSVTDLANQKNTTENRVVYIDTVYPLINFTSSSQVENTSIDFDDLNSIFVNVTVDELNEANITFLLFNSTSEVNRTLFTNSSRVIRWTGLTPEMYTWNVTIVDKASNINSTESRNFGQKIVNGSLEGIFYNLDVELGTNITAVGIYNFGEICLDINHPAFGVNYTCESNNFTNEIIINNFRKTNFSDNSLSNFFTYSGLETFHFNITGHQYDISDNLSINISGINSTGVTLFEVNTTNFDRIFDGTFFGTHIYLNDTTDDKEAVNLSFSNPGSQIIDFYIDDGADFLNFTLDVQGITKGSEFNDSFNNYTYIDNSLTNAHLRDGDILPANSSLTEFSYDDFEDDIISSQWIWSANYSFIDPNQIGTIAEEDGVLKIIQTYAVAGGAGGSASMVLYSNLSQPQTYLNLYAADEISFGVTNQYSSEADNTGCAGNGVVHMNNGNIIWTSMYLPDDDDSGNAIESSTANITFILKNINETSWSVNITGTEVSSRYDSAACGSITQTNNWTNGTFFTSKANCPDVSGTLNNFFYNTVDKDGLAFIAFPEYTAGADCLTISEDMRIEFMNYTLWYRDNTTVISESILDSAVDIDKATLNSTFTNGINESIYFFMSSDNGANWESVTPDVEHTFSNPGTHLKWRADINVTLPGYHNLTTAINSVSITTPSGAPANITFDFGNDGIIEYTLEGIVNETNGTLSIVLEGFNLTRIFNTTPDLGNHLYESPLAIGSDAPGQINLFNFNLTYNPNPVILNFTAIEDFLYIFGNGETNFSVPIQSTNGNVNVSDLRYDYAGGNDTFEFLFHNPDYTLNVSYNLTYFFSQWDYSFVPEDIDWIYFSPETNESKNVTPYGQADEIPMLNLTNYGYGGRNADLSILMNQTNSCVDVFMSTNNTKPSSSLWDGLVAHYSFDIDARDNEGTNDGIVNGAIQVSGDNQDGLVGWWKLDAEEDLQDYSGNGNGGIVTGATFNKTGKIDGAYDFDGINDNIIVDDSAILKVTEGLTLSVWIYVDGVDPSSGSYDTIAGKGSYTKWGIIEEPSGLIIFDFDTSGQRNPINIMDTTGKPGWHHLVGTYDSSTMVSKTFLNGTLVNNESTGLGIITTDSQNFRMGGVGAAFFNGSIDDVRIYNRSLSDGEIKSIYEQRDFTQGNAYDFDGDNDYVDIGNDVSLRSPNLTISGWVKTDSQGTQTHAIVGITQYGLRKTSTNKPEGFIWGCNVIGSTNLDNNSWYYLTYVYNGTNGLLYVNGNSEGTMCSGDTRLGSNNIFIGARDASAEDWNGSIDEVMIYNRSLTQAEINELYERTRLKYYDKKLANDFQFLGTNRPYLFDYDLWMWADYTCSYDTWTLFEPNYFFRQCATNSTCSEEVI